MQYRVFEHTWWLSMRCAAIVIALLATILACTTPAWAQEPAGTDGGDSDAAQAVQVDDESAAGAEVGEIAAVSRDAGSLGVDTSTTIGSDDADDSGNSGHSAVARESMEFEQPAADDAEGSYDAESRAIDLCQEADAGAEKCAVSPTIDDGCSGHFVAEEAPMAELATALTASAVNEASEPASSLKVQALPVASVTNLKVKRVEYSWVLDEDGVLWDLSNLLDPVVVTAKVKDYLAIVRTVRGNPLASLELVLTDDGLLWNYADSSNPSVLLTGVASIFPDSDQSNGYAVLMQNGSLYVWNCMYGFNMEFDSSIMKGITGTPEKILDNVVDFWPERYCYFAITDNRTLYSWGYNGDGELGLGYKSEHSDGSSYYTDTVVTSPQIVLQNVAKVLHIAPSLLRRSMRRCNTVPR